MLSSSTPGSLRQLLLVVRVENQNLILLNTGEQYIMLHLVVEADDSHAATMKSIVDLALLAHIYTLAGEVTAGERQLRHLAEAV